MVIPLFAIKIAMWTLFRTKTNAVSEAKLIAGVDAESKGEVGRWTGVGGGGGRNYEGQLLLNIHCNEKNIMLFYT